MPKSRKRKSTANAAARRSLNRRRAHAAVRRMVDMAEQRVMRMAKAAGATYCPHRISEGGHPCMGRLKTHKRGGKVAEGEVRCSRCGRDYNVVDLPKPTEDTTPEVCTTCVGAGVLEYRNKEGVVYQEACPDCGPRFPISEEIVLDVAGTEPESISPHQN